MKNSLLTESFFTCDACVVAQNLLGCYICERHGTRYKIIETEAYFPDEEFCYGHGKTKATAARLVSAPLFDKPGTWCVYGGQLLLSVTDDQNSDNVLIKRVIGENGGIYGPDAMANILHLYKSKPGYCGCHGQYALSKDSALFLEDRHVIPSVDAKKRVGINDDKLYNFSIKGK